MIYQSYLFDLYGTLADIHTDEEKKELWKKLAVWYASHGAFYTDFQIRAEYHRLSLEKRSQAAVRHPDYTTLDIQVEHVFEALYTQKGIPACDDLIKETALFFRTISRRYIRLYPQVRPMLLEMRKQGKQCYLLTNAQEVFTMPELLLLNIADLFHGIVISSSQECAKPDPHFFEVVHKRYQLDPSKTIMVGNDPRTDIAGANTYGIASVYIHSNLSPKWEGTPQSTYCIRNGNTEQLKKLLLSM